MVAATDLSEPAWQERTSDEQIAAVIRQGKGAMPAFDLPDGTVQGLVKLVRLFHAGREASPSGAPSAAPSGAEPLGATPPSAAPPNPAAPAPTPPGAAPAAPSQVAPQ